MKTAQTAPLEERFQARGLREGKGYAFTSVDVLVEALFLCAVNEDISGKSFFLVHWFFYLVNHMQRVIVHFWSMQLDPELTVSSRSIDCSYA